MTLGKQTSFEAVDDFCNLFGPPSLKRVGGVRVFTWRGPLITGSGSILSPAGDGILVCPSPGRASRQKLWTEFGSLLALAQKLDLRPSTLMVTLGGSGNQDYAERQQTDVGEIEAGTADGRYQWVAYADIERISRSAETFERIISLLRSSGTDLYLGNWGRRIDCVGEARLLKACGSTAIAEAENLRRRR